MSTDARFDPLTEAEFEQLAWLLLKATVGLCDLTTPPAGLAGQPNWRRPSMWAWSLSRDLAGAAAAATQMADAPDLALSLQTTERLAARDAERRAAAQRRLAEITARIEARKAPSE